MPSRISHGIAGIISGSLINLTSTIVENSDEGFDVQKAITRTTIGGFAGYLGGIIPDILEPPTNSFHRKALHSKVIGILMIMGVSYSIFSFNRKTMNSFIESFGTGYLSHLILDSATSRGLPFR